MAFDIEQFLILARELDKDARYRTTVSRAYYAAHLICKKVWIQE